MLSLYSAQLPNIHLSKIMCDLGRSKTSSSVLCFIRAGLAQRSCWRWMSWLIAVSPHKSSIWCRWLSRSFSETLFPCCPKRWVSESLFFCCQFTTWSVVLNLNHHGNPWWQTFCLDGHTRRTRLPLQPVSCHCLPSRHLTASVVVVLFLLCIVTDNRNNLKCHSDEITWAVPTKRRQSTVSCEADQILKTMSLSGRCCDERGG